jgi:hypothetical protein
VADAPPGATPVVVHTATIAYLSQRDRVAVADEITRTGARWVSFEGRDVVAPSRRLPEPLTPGTSFTAALERDPHALANGHGDTMTLLRS